ncbi:hypothetical protein AM500_02560 [Bacillus sp. FJAT-18017]|uniref:nuclease-related domain-containing protein n=1 Tax=Bacillus sp. FJAT-18017 TaxID=1705566 RepID=UPI0006AE9B96|nr:nuclease-related domain-containing protein [Bacillus sp. FJAT-18017]ALC88804.1 hypothetical protein AM500_02560 [Bacillus sp. FJAT-18017]
MKRSKPKELLELEVILDRLRRGHPAWERIKEKHRILMAGYNGEKNVDYHLSFLDDRKFRLIPGLRLEDKHFFQMDNVALCQSFYLNLEVKNYAGPLSYNPQTDQFIQHGDPEKAYPNPISQADRHAIQFQHVLQKEHLPVLPIISLAVMSYSSTIIYVPPGYETIFNRLIYADQLLRKIDSLEVACSIPRITEPQPDDVYHTLLKKHTRQMSNNTLEKYNISIVDLFGGVQCPFCKRYKMLYRSAHWFCPSCRNISKDAYIKAVNDYLILYKPFITNEDFRKFAGLESRKAATKMLSALDLVTIGTNKGTIYFLTFHPLLT